MWTIVARIILRNRILLLVILGLITAFMAYKAKDVQMSYEYAKLLPETDSTFVQYERFKKTFGEEANIFVYGIEDPNFFKNIDQFNDWRKLSNEIDALEGITNTISIAEVLNLVKNSELKKFETKEIFPDKIESVEQLDSLKNIALSLPIYRGMLYNDTANVYLTAVTLSNEVLDSKARVSLVEEIKVLITKFEKKHNIQVRYSGLPFIRTTIMKKIKGELNMFIILALLVCITILYLFFRSFRVVMYSMLVVGVGVVWVIGSMVLFDYKITVLTGMIPPLLIVIGIPNVIFLLNKYHAEYKNHGNNIMALQRVIRKIGNAIFLTNLTTASGFATFILTNSEILKEFGVIASLNIMGVFLLALLIIPIVFSFAKPPKERHTKHLDNKIVNKLVNVLVHITLGHRTKIYIVTIAVVVIGFFGISLMKTTGYMVDDIPHEDQIYVDLKFFEENFNGVLPLEISIDTKKPNGALKLSTLKKIDKLQEKLNQHPELSKPLSFAEVVKFSRQAFFNGKEKHYKLPSNQEKNFIMSYAAKNEDKSNLMRSFIDSTKRITRISIPIKDIGTTRMIGLTDTIQMEIDSIFSPEKYNTVITGVSIISFKGTSYLIRNLFVSLALAILIISFFMAGMFRSFRMIVISLIPNLIPLVLTASLMGYFGIPIKPSTILVFSIAFGISVDDTIHFLAKYRQELVANNWDIGKSVTTALRETGVSMMYTSIVLFFGFGIFVASNFGGTVALGLLVSFTLLVAMMANLILLPALLFTLEKKLTIKAFKKEPLLQIYDEEEDIDLEELTIQKRE